MFCDYKLFQHQASCSTCEQKFNFRRFRICGLQTETSNFRFFLTSQSFFIYNVQKNSCENIKDHSIPGPYLKEKILVSNKLRLLINFKTDLVRILLMCDSYHRVKKTKKDCLLYSVLIFICY